MSETSHDEQDIGKEAVPYTVFSGFCMGAADVVPGVSGGTMAVALGIYEQLLSAITTVGTDALKALLRPRELLSIVHWRFLLSLACGVALGIGVMVKVIGLPQMVAHDSPTRVHVYALFFGMVLASAVVLARHLENWSASLAIAVLAGSGVGFAIVNLVPVDTPDHPAFIFFAGSIAICAMLLPGISGSFILLILGKYAYILNALSDLQLSVIIPFSLGCLCGLLFFARLLNWLLGRFHAVTLATLIGLLIGSLWRIWPYQQLSTVTVRHKVRVVSADPFLPGQFEVGVWSCLVVGVVLVIGIETYASRRRASHSAIAAHEAEA